jgi:hypothetical protein
MNYLLGVLGKKFSALTADEFVTLLAILVVCGLLVLYAVTLLLRQLQRVGHPTPQRPNLAKSFKTVGSLQDYRSFTD